MTKTTLIDNPILYYFARCRKCENIIQHGYGTVRTQKEYNSFKKLMTERIVSPELLDCDKCNQDTVQDHVSFTPNPFLK